MLVSGNAGKGRLRSALCHMVQRSRAIGEALLKPQPTQTRRERSTFGVARSEGHGRSPVHHVGKHGGWSVPAEAARRNDRLKFAEVQIADCAQRLGGRTVLQVIRQALQPRRETYLRFHEARDVVRPTLGPSAMISRTAVADDTAHRPRARRDSGPGVRLRSWLADANILAFRTSASIVGRHAAAARASTIDLRCCGNRLRGSYDPPRGTLDGIARHFR